MKWADRLSLTGQLMLPVILAVTLAAVLLPALSAAGAGELGASLGGLMLAALPALVLAGWLAGRMRARLGVARAVAVEVTEGRFDGRLAVDGSNEPVRLLVAMDAMRRSLAARCDEERAVAEANLRIRNALDAAKVSVMLADMDGMITYMNASAHNMLGRAERSMGGSLPGGVRAADIVGKPFDVFHRNAPVQRGLIATLRDTYRTEIRLGEFTFQLVLNPVLDASGCRTGTVLEWYERTDEAALRGELAELIERAASGDFSGRVPLSGKSGFFLQLAEGLNRLMEVISGSVEEVARVLDAVARGELTEQIAGEYRGTLGRLKDDTNATVAWLREVVERIKESAETISAASRQIAAGNGELSARTEEQASSLQQTASAMEQLNATVHQNADNARVAQELAKGANAVAERGGATMHKVVATMGDIQRAARRIEDIIGVIDAIAFQTNILAVNAAVEAARAGEAGRGFAVVAGEVRALAKRSAQSAREVKGLIADSVGQVEGGVRLVDEAGRTMEEIVEAFQRVSALVSGIAEASGEQSLGIEQVTVAVGRMDQMTQHNAALVEDAAAAAASLEEQSRELVEAVGVFDVGGAPAVAPRTAARSSAADAARVATLAPRPAMGGVRSARGAPLPKVRKPAALQQALQDEWEEF
jgi:methyl-accepting chemotaxis protein